MPGMRPRGASIGLTRLTRDLAVRTVYRGLVAGPGGDVFAAEGSVWVRGSEGTISRIDAAGGRLLERISPDRPLSGGSLIVAFGSIWTTAGDKGRVIRPATRSLGAGERAVASGAGPSPRLPCT